MYHGNSEILMVDDECKEISVYANIAVNKKGWEAIDAKLQHSRILQWTISGNYLVNIDGMPALCPDR